MTIIYPDKEFSAINSKNINRSNISIFLAGTIDNGNSKDWQSELIKDLENIEDKLSYELTIYNPRRFNYDSNASKQLLEEQIKWEQEYLDKADLIIMNLANDSKSPISLLELGLYAKSEKIIVFCSNTFYRYDNIRLTCEKYNIPLFDNLTALELIKHI